MYKAHSTFIPICAQNCVLINVYTVQSRLLACLCSAVSLMMLDGESERGVRGIKACVLHKRRSHLLQTTCHVQADSTLLCPCLGGPARKA